MRDNIKYAAEEFKKYAIVGESTNTAEKAAQYIKKIIPLEIGTWGINELTYKIKGSVGEGRTLETPWITIMRKSITTSVQRGVFVIWIYSADLKEIFLGLMLGCQYFNGSGKKQKERIRSLSNSFAQALEIPEDFIKDPMPLGGNNSRTKNYSIASICYKRYEVSDLPSDKELRQDFSRIMDIYELFRSLKGNRSIDKVFAYYEKDGDMLVDTNTMVSSEDCSEEDFTVIDKPELRQEPIYDRKGKKIYVRDHKKKENALKAAGFMCEYDANHFSFWTKKNAKRMYVEAHHLIPLNKNEEFKNSLDVEANIVALCPNCHRCLHYGSKKEREPIIKALLMKRKDRLKICHIDISKEISDHL